jgi:Nif-specific regulatory protein
VILDDLSLAERQCIITQEGTRFRIRDLDPHVRTFVNGLPAADRLLKPGDHIKIGNSVFLALFDPHVDVRSCPVQLVESIAESVIRMKQAQALDAPNGWQTDTFPVTVQQRNDLPTVCKIGAALSAFRSLVALKRHLLELLFEVIPAQRGAVMMCQGRPPRCESVLGWDRTGTPDGPVPVQVSESISEAVLHQGVGLCSNDVRPTEVGGRSGVTPWRGWPADGNDGNPGPMAPPAFLTRRAVLAAPITVGDDVLGVIYLETADPAVRFDRNHLQLLTVVGGLTGLAVQNLRQIERLAFDNHRVNAHASLQHHDLLGDSAAIQRVFRFISKAAPTDSTVLLQGESGTGKELVARAIHRNSPRADRPFVAINCAAIPETLIESELFGYERGAFTGALAQKSGRFDIAEGGTLLLDEISELPILLQPKLLRALEERQFERLGGTRPIKVDIRVIASTNVDLSAAVAAGRFRSDLYFRLSVLPLTLPRLAERREDIPVIARYFAAWYSDKTKRMNVVVTPEVDALLLNYDWPGNVRELQHAIEHAVVLGSGPFILPEDLPATILDQAPRAKDVFETYHGEIRRKKVELIAKALEQAGGSYTHAARALGLNPTYLHRLIRHLDLADTLKSRSKQSISGV